MKHHTFAKFMMIATWALSALLRAAEPGDILLQLRFYEGARGARPAEAKVVTAYTLRPLFVGNFISEKGLREEEAELKRVFNLRDLEVLAQTQWAWERGRDDKRFQMVVLNGHEFLLQVVKRTEADAFQVRIIDQSKGESSPLLDNELMLPAGKVAVFGFEDTLSQPYFLALQRQADAEVLQLDSLQAVSKPEALPLPRVLSKVDPVYPEAMLKSGATASITLQVGVNEEGKVWNVKAFRSDRDEFVRAAVEAVRQWRLEPLVVNGQARPQSFTCTFIFHGGGKVALDFSRRAAPLNPAEKALFHKLRGLSESFLGPGYKAGETSFNFKDAPPSEKFTQFVSRIAGFPIAVDPAVKARITCDIPDMPWDQALARLLDMHALDIVRKEDGLLIVSPFKAIWPTAGYVWERGEKRPDGTIAALVKRTGKMYHMSSGFGKRLNPYTKREEFHPGIDIMAKMGAPVNSAAAGKVTASEFNDQDGNRILIDHGNGYTTAYHHLYARAVKAGDHVEQGQRIGTVGSSGVSTGPHLHFEIRVNGEPQNPFDFIGQ